MYKCWLFLSWRQNFSNVWTRRDHSYIGDFLENFLGIWRFGRLREFFRKSENSLTKSCQNSRNFVFTQVMNFSDRGWYKWVLGGSPASQKRDKSYSPRKGTFHVNFQNCFWLLLTSHWIIDPFTVALHQFSNISAFKFKGQHQLIFIKKIIVGFILPVWKQKRFVHFFALKGKQKHWRAQK